MEESRKAFVQDVQTHRASKAELCRLYGISRPTGDKWLKRWEEGEGYSDRSHAPLGGAANKTAPEIEQIIVQMRRQFPMLGAAKLYRIMQDKGYKSLPCEKTFNNILKRNGLILPQDSMNAQHYQRFQMPKPNMMWQADFKGDYPTGDGVRCHPLAILDDCSRYCLCGDLLTGQTRALVQPSFERTMRNFGMPNMLLCDNGHPWGTSQYGGITGFGIWLLERDILVCHIPHRYPQAQGKVERFNGSFERECLRLHQPKDLSEAIAQRHEYCVFYNEFRPHHALHLDVPATHYTASSRQFLEVVQPWIYPHGKMVRKVKENGMITVFGKAYNITHALSGRHVYLQPSAIDDGILFVSFRNYFICEIDLRSQEVINKHVRRIPRQP